VTVEHTRPNRWPPDREALLRVTMGLTVDQRVDWLEQMMLIAMETGALPKPVPDQVRTPLVADKGQD
jgi:hypothetical protein